MILAKNWLTGLTRRMKKEPARLYRKRQKMRYLRWRTNSFWIIQFNDWQNRNRKIIVIFLRTEIDDLGVVGIVRPKNFEWQKECCEGEFAKELDLND